MNLEIFAPDNISQQQEAGPQRDIYEVFDTQARRSVVIKRFPISATSPAGRRLLENLRQSMTLSHPYIARIYKVGVMADRPFLAMEALTARTLADTWVRQRPVNETPALAQIARQLGLIAAALDYAHAQRVIHGNLSAQHILLTDVEDPVLTGFGWEVAESGDQDSDLFALGGILYEWLTGRPLFEVDVFDLQSLNLPAAIRTVILKALAPDPAQRYPDAQALATAFASALADSRLEKEETGPPLSLAIGRYRIEAELGRRGPMTVYRAYDEKLARQVAIKILSAQTVTSPAFRARLKQEIELIATLEHPSIVKVYDFGDYESRPYVVMPYLEGGTLETRLRAVGSFEPQSLAPIIDRVAAALDEAHARGILHGQIMPSNILFDGQGQAYLSDFRILALAETGTDLTNLDNPANAAKYLSPEQVRAFVNAEPVRPDARSDIYALGVVLFEMLTGQTPYQAATPSETALAHLEAPIPLLRQINPDLPRAYQTIIKRTLAKDPQKRYPTAGTLSARLKEVQAGRGHLSHISDLIEVPSLPPLPLPQATAARSGTSPLEVTTAKKLGRYHLVRELGRGTMGVVYLAFDPDLKRQVAIKVLPAHVVTTPHLRRRFQHEAKLIARLDHDAIAHVYDVGDYDDQLFIVMRYLSGGTLAEKLAQTTLKLHQIGPIIQRVAEALDAAHAQHIIHYDVKPGNILFDARGEAFLADFGIAVLQERTTVETLENSIAGTPKYMSPEQVKAITKQTDRKKADGRSDIYALGVVLFEMLTGQVPYQVATPRATALAHLTEPVPDILKLKPNLPAAGQEVINRALAKNPAERYQTAQELAQDVSELTSGRWLLRQLIE